MALVPMHPRTGRTWTVRSRRASRPGRHERDYRVIPRPGEVRWLRSRGKVYRDAHGAAVRMTGSLTDITERKLAADALRASEERYSLAMEASEEGHVDVNIDTGEFVTSERLNEIFGFAPGTRFRGRGDFLSQFRFYGNDAETPTIERFAPSRPTAGRIAISSSSASCCPRAKCDGSGPAAR